MILRPPISTRTDTLFSSTTLFRSISNSELIAQRVHAFLVDGNQRIVNWNHFFSVLEGYAADLRPSQLDDSDASSPLAIRSEEQTSELQSLMRISSDIFSLHKNTYSNRILLAKEYQLFQRSMI